MPDPSLMHGRALPAPELADGTVTVRLMRETVGNDIPDQDVQVTAGGQTVTARTDAEGRAEFTGLLRGAEARAEAVVDGETLISEPFTVPPAGGLRIILFAGLRTTAAGDAPAPAPATPAVPGSVRISGNSRILMEFQNDALNVFYLLDVVNDAGSPVDIGGPLILELPTGAGGATVLQGSTTNASVSGETVTVLGPFPPGSTPVQVAFVLRHDSPNLTITQEWPVPVDQVMAAVERVGATSLSSPQFGGVQEVQAQNGTPFVMGTSPALPAGTTMTLQLTGLPAHNSVPRYVALTLAVAILAAGGYFAFAGRPNDAEVRRRLVARRDSLLGELAALDARQRRKGAAPTPAEKARRQRLLSELEHIYGELDEAGPRGGGEGVAA